MPQFYERLRQIGENSMMLKWRAWVLAGKGMLDYTLGRGSRNEATLRGGKRPSSETGATQSPFAMLTSQDGRADNDWRMGSGAWKMKKAAEAASRS